MCSSRCPRRCRGRDGSVDRRGAAAAGSAAVGHRRASGPGITVTGVADPAQHLRALCAGGRADRLLHVERIPAREARVRPWPDDLDPVLLGALTAAGMGSAWAHQREAVDLARAGRHVVLPKFYF